MENRILNERYEEAVLGILLTHPIKIYEVSNRISSPKMFSTIPNEEIYKSMLNIMRQEHEPEYLSVIGNLQERGKLDDIGGEERLKHLLNTDAKPNQLSQYVSKVLDAYKARQLLKINSNIPRLLDERPHRVNEVITSLHKELDNLVAEIDNESVSSVADIIDETYNRILERRKNPGIRGISTGFSDVDAHTGGIVEGDIWYIGARPTVGKSSWLTKSFMNAARQGTPVLIFSREMGIHDINERMLSIISQVPALSIRLGTLSDREAEKVMSAKDELKGLPIYIDNNFGGGIDYVTSTIRKYYQLYGIKLVGIDYLQLVVERSELSTHLLGDASRRLKLLANELKIAIVILSQMNRNVESRENKRPLMSDLRQSGNLEEDADVMVALYRDELYNDNSPDKGKIEFIMRKVRNGPVGTAVLNFDETTINIYQEGNRYWNKGEFLG